MVLLKRGTITSKTLSSCFDINPVNIVNSCKSCNENSSTYWYLIKVSVKVRYNEWKSRWNMHAIQIWFMPWICFFVVQSKSNRWWVWIDIIISIQSFIVNLQHVTTNVAYPRGHLTMEWRKNIAPTSSVKTGHSNNEIKMRQQHKTLLCSLVCSVK